MRNLKVSIIVPVYNTEKYIRETLDSLINQSYKNIEVIIVDDGSTDSCCSIYNEYCNRDSRFSAYKKKNEGLGLTRNYGMGLATGDYLTFLDSDDWYSYDHIYNMINIIGTKELPDVILGGCTYCSADGTSQNEFLHSESQANCVDDIIQAFLLPMIGPEGNSNTELSVPMSVCFNLYKTEIIRKKDLRFISEKEVVGEDLFFNIAFLSSAERAIATSETGYNYRMNPKSISRSYKPERFSRTEKFYPLLIQYEEKYGIDDCGFSRAKRGSLSKYRALINLISNSDMSYNRKRKEIKNVLKSEVLRDILSGFDFRVMRPSLRITTLVMNHRLVDLLIFLFVVRNYRK